MKRVLALIVTICTLNMMLLITSAAPQKKFAHAVERSDDAGRIIASLALLPDTGFPQELIGKAEAVAVFPRIQKQNALFMQATQGYGVICSRTENGWTMPAFYQFSGGAFASPFAKNETFSILLLFMTKDAVAAFEKGGVQLKGEKKAFAGPVGAITEDQRKALEGAHILAYTYFNGKLKGIAFEKGFGKNFSLDPDNNINTPIYGMKGREVLAGKKVDTGSLLSGISAYQEALQKYYGVG